MARPSKKYQALKRRAENPCESPAQTPPASPCTFAHRRARIRLAANDLPFNRNDKAEDFAVLWVDALTVLEGDIPRENHGIPLRDVIILSHPYTPPYRRTVSVGSVATAYSPVGSGRFSGSSGNSAVPDASIILADLFPANDQFSQSVRGLG